MENYLIKDLINIVDEYANDNREKYDLVMIQLRKELDLQRYCCDSGIKNWYNTRAVFWTSCNKAKMIKDLTENLTDIRIEFTSIY
ncbi:MAG TPA: hypothetical protein PLS50_01665 [Candidatus Dojkabacteria bacterium]|nr:hypothetical protein [Candidatus Dojkabacteria bacterium]